MADRVLVMHEGKIAAELSRSEATEEAIMFAATGQTAAKMMTKQSKESANISDQPGSRGSASLPPL
jgi:ABC-type uncharacterized transport system ATPase subunit